MSVDRTRLRWNGWGRLGQSYELSRSREEALRSELGKLLGRPLEPAPPPASLADVRLPPSKLGSDVLAALRAACGHDGVRTSVEERATHAAGKSLIDLVRLRRGEIEHAPEAVVYPPDEGAVAAVLRLAGEAGFAVVPFGGGTSVLGGVEARSVRGQTGAVALDTTRLDRLVRVDAESRTATFQAGIEGPALEAALAARGFTLGHFPQSFEHSTLGGWIATRSSGQQSNGYGSIEGLLVALRVVTPRGVLRSVPVPRSAAGPDLNQLLLGSEGAFGVIVEASVRVRPAPTVQDYRGVLFHSFADGVAAIRDAVGEQLPVAMLRLADAAETELGARLRRDPARRFDATARGLAVLQRAGYGPGRCLLVYGVEGRDARRTRATATRMRRIARRHGGFALGRGPGRGWRRERFRAPYLRDWLLDHGVAVDTFETAFSWSRLETGHDAVLRALRGVLERQAGGGLAMTHLSHSYPDGACLYFTALWPLDTGREIAQWTAIKHATTEAILAAGGTLSHHHGVGLDHAAWLVREKGALGVDALRAVKRNLDPDGILNPGKLL